MYVPEPLYSVSKDTSVGVTEFDAPLTGPVPAPFVATAENVYEVQLVKPDTVTGDEAPVPVTQPGDDLTVYPVIALLPVQDGAVKATLTAPPVVRSVAVPIVGAPGLLGQMPCLA